MPLPPNKYPNDSFDSRFFTLQGRQYEIIGAYYQIENGRKVFYQMVKNDRGEHKDIEHYQLLRQVRKDQQRAAKCEISPSTENNTPTQLKIA